MKNWLLSKSNKFFFLLHVVKMFNTDHLDKTLSKRDIFAFTVQADWRLITDVLYHKLREKSKVQDLDYRIFFTQTSLIQSILFYHR